MRRVIIIGGGFGGLNAAKALKGADVEVLLLDRTNHHVFQPLLYQVATAALSVANIAGPIREILKRQKNATVLLAEVEKIDLEQQSIKITSGEVYNYDDLILAPGARHSYFGHDHWEAYAPGLKTIADALRIRDKILMAYEKAERADDPDEAQKEMRFVIIGGGPTGVELAGSLAEFAHHTLINNFRNILPKNTTITLLEGGPQLLPGFDPKLAKEAQNDLEQLGVDIYLNTFATQVEPNGVYAQERFFEASTILWAAGNQASPLLKHLDIPLDQQGRALVNPDLTIPGHPNVFIIGDAACCTGKKGAPLPAIAPVAIQQGKYVARLIKNPSKRRKAFFYFDKGMMAAIGRGEAVVMLRRLKFGGFFAWFVWCFVHIFYLISFRYKLLVMIQWIFLYLFSRRQGRVISKNYR
ncbi:MAG: NAD(P)/FAD-dependent oxidoreductase [Parachlamydia sp.]|jgi:NADH dehydrogenase|nr:NAD(P)/FAD-dependent oxidoreductase [Parachlamydia sp.]